MRQREGEGRDYVRLTVITESAVVVVQATADEPVANVNTLPIHTLVGITIINRNFEREREILGCESLSP